MSSFAKQKELIKAFASLGSVTLSLLLVGFSAITDHQFTCPCRNDQNTMLTVSIFIGPAIFAFVLMYHLLRPFRYGWFQCPERVEEDTPEEEKKKKTKNCPKALISCLIPPVIWIFILLLDGNFLACAKTDWNGVYATDGQMQWCQPTEGRLNDTEFKDLTRKFIHDSQYAGYVLISVFSFLSFGVMAIYDCCISGKCEWCPSGLLLLSRCKVRHVEENEEDDLELGLTSVRQGGVNKEDRELSPTSPPTTHALIALS